MKPTIPFVITSFGLPHVMGYLATRGGEKCPQPLTAEGLMDTAVELRAAGIEMPVPASDPAATQQFRADLEARGLMIVAAFGGVLGAEPQVFKDYLDAAAAVGARVARVTLSGVLCGDRRKLDGGWENHLRACGTRLREILPYAADRGLAIAVENHQDATCDDFLRLAEMVDHHPAFGVTLDAGNPLAVGEEPVETAQRLAPLIRHLHLKDYTIHFAPEGYRLVRCAAGQGVVDFPAILKAVGSNGHSLLPGIEIAAQATRTIPLLEESWWACYPERPVTALLPALRILWEKGWPDTEPYSSAWERGEASAAVVAEEWDVLRKSVEYFRSLSGALVEE